MTILAGLTAPHGRLSIWADTGGNLGSLAAILTPVLIGAVGLAVDVTHSINVRSRLTAAADAAVLAGVKMGADAVSAGDATWLKLAEDESTALFEANIASQNLNGVKFKPVFTKSGTTVEGDATYVYDSPTYFMNIFGRASVELGRTSKASVTGSNFVDIGFLIDNSASMGVGASLQDQETMYNAVGCAFACHMPKNPTDATHTPQKAHALGAKLRIDVVRDAMLSALDELEERREATNQVRISIHTFSNQLTTLLPPETNFTKVREAIQKLDMVGNGGTGPRGGSYISGALRDLESLLPKAGTGDTSSDRRSFVVLFSDGIEDTSAYKPAGRGLLGNLLTLIFGAILDKNQDYVIDTARWQSNPNHEDRRNVSHANAADGSILQPFLPSACDTLKKKRTVYTAQIEYVAGPGFRDQKDWWNPPKVDYLESRSQDFENAFKACATTPTNAVKANNSGEIDDAFQAIIDQIIGPKGIRLTH